MFSQACVILVTGGYEVTSHLVPCFFQWGYGPRAGMVVGGLECVLVFQQFVLTTVFYPNILWVVVHF